MGKENFIVNFSEELFTTSNASKIFSEKFFNETAGWDIVPCKLYDADTSQKDSTFKDIIIGRDSNSPLYVVFIRPSFEFIKNLSEKYSECFEYAVIIDFIRNVMGFEESISINRSVIFTDKGFLYKIYIGENHEDNPDIVVYEGGASAEASLMVALPRKTFIDSKWNILTENETILRKTILHRLKNTYKNA